MPPKKSSVNPNNYLIVDLSYWNFYRYYALIQWFKHAHPDSDLPSDFDWTTNVIFMEKFPKLFEDNLVQICKKRNIPTTNIFLIKDCPRNDIWRVKHFDNYKGSREITYTKTNFQGGKVFKYCHETIIPKFLDTHKCKYFGFPSLEADDCIYLSTKKLMENPDYKLWIISSDKDLLQILDLGRDRIILMDASCKEWNHKSKGSKDKDIWTKIIMGDSSDDIPKIIPGVGEKTLDKILNDLSLLEDYKKKDPSLDSKITLNSLLVNFENIPTELSSAFLSETFP